MRTIVTLIVSFLLAEGVLYAQNPLTNQVGRAEAIEIAKRLWVGMPEKTASKVLAESGLTNLVSLGALTGWSHFYGLSDGTSLALDYTSRAMPTNHWWQGDGLLIRAFIQSNGVNIVSITLTNAP